MTETPTCGLGHVALQRVRDRATFAALRQAQRRARRGAVTVSYVPEPSTTASRVAYAVSRRVGTAVVRNRVRRRLRVAMAELGGAPGAYLITARPEASVASYQALRADLERAVEAVSKGREL